MSDRVRIGVVGAGSISLRGILPHLCMADVQDRVQVTTICDPVEERAQAAAAKFGIPAAFQTYEALLASGWVAGLTPFSSFLFCRLRRPQARREAARQRPLERMTQDRDLADQLPGAASRGDQVRQRVRRRCHRG